MRRCAAALAAAVAACAEAASVRWLADFGPPASTARPPFEALTPAVAAGDGRAGWIAPSGLSAFRHAHREMVANPFRGRQEPPPIWTTPETEDAVWSVSTNSLIVPVPPGEYDVWLLAGSSDGRHAAWVFDFDFAAGGATDRVQVAGAYHFELRRLRAGAEDGALRLDFLPRNRWIANAVMIWPAGDATAEGEVLAPLREAVFGLPPHERDHWVRDPDPPTAPPRPPRPEEEARGFVLWNRHWQECVYPRDRPREDELDPVLCLFAAPGEYEPATFVVRPLRPLTGARVEVGDVGPVRGADTDIRKVRYMAARPNWADRGRWRIVPDVLERFRGGALPAEENARFWLTFRIPDDAPPGLYEGRIRFVCDRGAAEVPVRLRVLPFRLREDPSRRYAIYYHHPFDLAAAAPDAHSADYWRRKAELEHADMAAHGIRNVVLSVRSGAAGPDGRFAIDWVGLEAKMDLWGRHGFVGPVVMGVDCDAIYRKHMNESYGVHLRNVRRPPPAFAEELAALVRQIEAGRRARGWPEFLYYPVDEPSTDPAAVEFMSVVLAAVRSAEARTYVTADPTLPGFAPLRPWVDVWCSQPFALDEVAVRAEWAERAVEHWCYPNHIAGENDHTPVGGARMTFGFGFWRSGYRALIPWIYQGVRGNPWNYLDHPSMDFLVRSEPDGTPIPVALWEAYREGWDDVRYIATLEWTIREARRWDAPRIRDAAAAAERELAAVRDAIRAQPKYIRDDLWGGEEFDVRRWQIARRILALRSAMDEVARAAH